MCVVSVQVGRFLSTLSLRRATVHYDNYNLHCVISIHALLAESDPPSSNIEYTIKNFYPRSPCGERPQKRYPAILGNVISIHALLAESDLDYKGICVQNLEFLSTLSLRRATLNQIPPRRFHYHFYPRSPCGERRARRESRQQPAGISIHALLAESDNNINSSVNTADKISIHALLAESDGSTTLTFPGFGVISIHALLAESDMMD